MSLIIRRPDWIIRELQNSTLAEIPGRVQYYFSQLHDPRLIELFRQTLFFRASSATPEGLAIKRAVNENPPHAWKCLVRENCPNVLKGNYGQGSYLNERFGKSCYAAVLKQLQMLRRGEKITLGELYDIYAEVRHQLAVESKTPEADNFGKKRVEEWSSYYTRLKDGFLPYVARSQRYYLEAIQGLTPIEDKDFVLNQALHLLSHPEHYRVYEICMNASEPPCYVIVRQKPGEESTLMYVLTTSITDKGETEILSGISYSDAGYKINGRCFGMAAYANEGSDPFIQHCAVKRLDSFFKRAEMLFKSLLETSDSKQVALYQIAELEAILDNAIRIIRGNSSVSAMIILTVLLLKDFLVTPCKEGIYSDLEALTLPRREFINNFPLYRTVNLSFTVSPFMHKVINILGSIQAYEGLPLFTSDPTPYIGPTDYPQNIFNRDMSAPLMRFTDRGRDFILLRSSLSVPHIFFQRCTGDIHWRYRPPEDTGPTTVDIKDMPWALFKEAVKI